MTAEDSRHQDWSASLAAHRELGDEYDRAFVDGVVERVSAEVDARVDERLSQWGLPWQRYRRRGTTFLAVTSMVLGIPLSAIAGAFGHLAGLAIAWGGIVLVNVAHAWRPRERKPVRRR